MELNRNQLVYCMHLANQAYGNIPQTDLDNLRVFDFDDIEGFVGEKNNICYIAFRGSDDISDWKSNFKFWKRPYKKIIPYEGVNPKIRVHYGFIKDYKKTRAFILNCAKKFEKVVCTGHSLGGALAIFAALDIQYNLDPEISCVPFASPRVGNAAFARSFNGRVPDCYRFVYGQDIVTKLPSFMFCYHHVNYFLQLGEKKWYKFFGSISDHCPERYVEATQDLNF